MVFQARTCCFARLRGWGVPQEEEELLRGLFLPLLLDRFTLRGAVGMMV